MPHNLTPTAARAMADRVAEATADAFSWDAYGEQNWQRACRMLARHGLTAREIEAIMRSKWTRWAGDQAEHTGRTTASDLERFVFGPTQDAERLAADIRELVIGTFGFDEE